MPQRAVGLQVSITSPDLKIGAAANLNQDFVYGTVWVMNGDTPEPERLRAGVAELIYRGQTMASVTFDASHALEDGTISIGFLHPPHSTDLTVRVTSTVDGIGSGVFAVPVTNDPVLADTLATTLTRQDQQGPRAETSGFGAQDRELREDPNDRTDLSVDALRTLLILDPEDAEEPLFQGSGAIYYSGGGNRLLPNVSDGTLTRQTLDMSPMPLGLRTLIEPAATNLLLHSDFRSGSAALPTGLTLTIPARVRRKEQTTTTLVESAANQFRLWLSGSGDYTGAVTCAVVGAPVAVTFTAPVTFSVLVKSAVTGTVDDFDVLLTWLDAQGATVGTSSATFAPAEFSATEFTLLSVTAATLPAGAQSVVWSCAVASIDGGDEIDFTVALPQLELGRIATSRIPTGATGTARARDFLYVSQADNIDPQRGAIVLTFRPLYSGNPSAAVTFFDTRNVATQRQGWHAQQNTDGTLSLRHTDAAGTVTSSTSADPVQFTADQQVAVTFSWSSTRARIFVDDTLVHNQQWNVTPPSQINSIVALLTSVLGTEPVPGDLRGVEIWQEPR